MSAPLVERIDGVPVAHLSGDIDAGNVAVTAQRLAAALDPGALSMIVDLTEVRYLDSAGIDMLLRLAALLEARRAKLIVVIAAASPLQRLAAIVGLSQSVPVHVTLPEALDDATRPDSRSRPDATIAPCEEAGGG